MSYDESKFASIIDQILRESDLNTIGAKRVRKNLAARLGYNISGYEDQVIRLIEERFDKIHEETLDAAAAESPNHLPKTNGTSAVIPSPVTSAASSPVKRSVGDSDLSDVVDSPKPKKKRTKTGADEDDAAFAARLQAEEDRRSRSTRGGGTRKKAPVKRQKKKSAAKVKGDGNDESASEKEPQRKGGFHKPMSLSEPLSQLLGETQLSRPQTVKKIWEYVKARDLQDPSDKRQIRCDDAMRAVFKTDRVHMFTMNKILNQNLYAVDE
ncbi:hypothetical protein AAFC00_003599 [Neodothiora populina]|uniref:DM2 domain-containing protein n=1 Tax=Neodothiora populina TaxID=2781224 RepID=A0ABR3PER4_9PEZI